MTSAQARLLKACIEADRSHRSNRRLGEESWNDLRGLEINPVFGFHHRTAEALQAAGLIELVNLRQGQVYAFLGRYAEFDIKIGD